MQDGAPPSEATPMETEQKEAPAAAATPAAPQEVEEVVKKKRTRKTNVNFTAQTAGMQTEQLTVGTTFSLHCLLPLCWLVIRCSIFIVYFCASSTYQPEMQNTLVCGIFSMPCLFLYVVGFVESQARLHCLDGLHASGMQALYEKECHMALQDKVQEATNEAKNALEAYVYSLRNKLYDQLSDYVTDDFKESTSRKLEQMEVGSSTTCQHLLTCC